jgi:hypothetical protein
VRNCQYLSHALNQKKNDTHRILKYLKTFMPDNTRIANAEVLKTSEVWTNKHANVTQQYGRYYTINRPENADGTTILDDMCACARALQGIITEAVNAGEKVRCVGGAWSLSDAAATDGWMIDTLSMNLYWTMRRAQIDTGYTGNIKSLYLFQCGASVQEVNKTIEEDGMAMQTSGASNGQTIAGAVATGTHGSAFGYGSMTEFVVGIYLIVDDEKLIWLERATYPVVSEEFVVSLGATLERNDDLFNSVLVSFGSLGIIAGLMIETVPIYTLETKRFMIDVNDALRTAMNTMNLSGLNLNATGEIPWHFEVTFNPHKPEQGYARTMYKRPYPANYQGPIAVDGTLGPGEGLLSVIGTLTAGSIPAVVALAVDALVGSSLKLTDPAAPPSITTPSDTFPETTLRGQAMSMELGLAMEDSSRVMDLLFGLTPEIDVYAGVVSFRWVKQSTAMLGFTKFSTTCTIEFNAAHNDRTLAFYNRIWTELEANGISYTLHWGQMNNFTPQLVQAMYGDAFNKWIAARNSLLTESARTVFSNAFLNTTGLG